MDEGADERAVLRVESGAKLELGVGSDVGQLGLLATCGRLVLQAVDLAVQKSRGVS